MLKSNRIVLLSILPFAGGYYLSYVFRTINAVIADAMAHDLALGPAALGMLTSAYFLTFAAAQLPLGVMLDRFGPRRVQGTLMLLAAAGAALFATGHSFPLLLFGRGLVGLGVAGALMAGLKAIVLCLPRDRVPMANGWFIMLGAFGAVTATEPAEALLQTVGWRTEFLVLAIATAVIAAAILLLVQEPPVSDRPAMPAAAIGLRVIYADTRFVHLAPLSAICIGTAWALQGLWAAPWLADVGRLDHAAVVFRLFVMGLALCAGALFLGGIADRLRRAGIQVRALLGVVAIVLLLAEAALITQLPVPSIIPWSLVAMVGAATVISYAALADYFPKELAGRANSALNVLHIGTAFGIQSLVGAIIQRWPSDRLGHYPAVAYDTAFATIGGLLLVALVWFIWPVREPAVTAVPDAMAQAD